MTIDSENFTAKTDYYFESIGIHKISVLMDISMIDSIEEMFSEIDKMISISFTTKFNTENVLNMNSMFSYCNSLTSIEMSKLNTENLLNAQSMFEGCESLISLDLSNLNFKSITNMAMIFYEDSKLKSIILPKSGTPSLGTTSEMFGGCESLTSIDLA